MNHPLPPYARRAFTLVELLVVIGIIIALMGILVPVGVQMHRTAARAQIKAELQAISTALEAYRTDFQDYPRPDPGVTQVGFAILGKALVAPGGRVAPSAPAINYYSMGTATSSGSTEYLCTNTYNSTEPLAIAAPPGPHWVTFPYSDGKDGPGFRVSPNAVAADQGKPYGPYLALDSIRMNGLAILDRNQNAILYFPAAVKKPDITKANRYACTPVPGSGLPLFDYRDNSDASTNLATFSETGFKYTLGDRDLNGGINGTEVAAAANLPYLLWSAGIDGIFGPDPAYAGNTFAVEAVDLPSLDDVTNFSQ